ncbi:hypothetical protein [Chamaesiphon sp.]
MVIVFWRLSRRPAEWSVRGNVKGDRHQYQNAIAIVRSSSFPD